MGMEAAVKDHLAWCVHYLSEERTSYEGLASASPSGFVPAFPLDEVPASLSNQSFEDLWDAFRVLVNTREPWPAAPEFFKHQDLVLQAMIADEGITNPDVIPPAPLDDRLALWRGDITTIATDAIVNAANSRLLGCWIPGHFCIDNAIHTFAGVQLRLACNELMIAQGHEEPTGQAKVTPAFNLPAKFVIHTVGPIANGYPTDRHRQELASCYTHCLDAAAAQGCKSIAFCCISTGVFGFPQQEAAQIAVSTVRSWIDGHPDTPLRVVFNVFGETDEAIYQALLGY